MKLPSCLALVQLISFTVALTPAEWRNQSIYFIMTDRFARTDGSTTAPCNTTAGKYCGGTWKGIVDHLDYIQDMGFSAIWITPVTHQIQDSDGYHGYWQNDLYDVDPELGTSSDLKNLSQSLHDRGMYLMLDVVANHFAWTGTNLSVDYSTYNPFNSQEYFHPPATIDYGPPANQTSVETGWLVASSSPVLPDLNTTRQDVRDFYHAWIHELVANYSVDGLRVDTVKHVEQPFWPGFNEAAGVYCVGEVFETVNRTYLCDYQNYMDGVLNYGPYNEIQTGFHNSSGNLFALAEAVLEVQKACKDPTLLGSFMENHDNPRFPNATADITLAANAIAFTMLADGIPIIYQGQEQHYTGGQDPANREAIWLSSYNTDAELYKLITTLNRARTNAVQMDDAYLTTLQEPIYADANTLVMRKGSDGSAVIAVLSNLGSQGQNYTLDVNGLYTGYPANTSLTDVVSCCTVTVGENGNIAVPMASGAPRVLYATDKLNGLCSS